MLTGLPNRTLLADRLSTAIALTRRTGERTGVALIDLDGFKTINDTYGHETGDLVLKEVAQRLTRHIRDTDTAARLGAMNSCWCSPTCALVTKPTCWTKYSLSWLSPIHWKPLLGCPSVSQYRPDTVSG